MKRTSALAIVVMAVIGLFVSITAAWDHARRARRHRPSSQATTGQGLR